MIVQKIFDYKCVIIFYQIRTVALKKVIDITASPRREEKVREAARKKERKKRVEKGKKNHQVKAMKM